MLPLTVNDDDDVRIKVNDGEQQREKFPPTPSFLRFPMKNV
jgi:hypothetical protein